MDSAQERKHNTMDYELTTNCIISLAEQGWKSAGRGIQTDSIRPQIAHLRFLIRILRHHQHHIRTSNANEKRAIVE